MKKSLMVALLILSLSGCGDSNKPVVEGKDAALPQRTVKVSVSQTTLQDIQVSESALGRVVDPQATTVGAELPGRVQRVMVDAGDAVEQGQLLAELDDADAKTAVAVAQAELKRLTAQYDAQQRLVQRYRNMIEKRFVSSTILEQAEAQLDVLHEGVAAAESSLQQAKTNLQRTRVTAPVAGRIQVRYVAAGDYIGLGKPLFQVADGSRLTVAIALPETRAARIRVGQMVRMHLPGSEQLTMLPISELTPMVGRSNAFEARVVMDHNPGGWRAGGSVMAEIITDTHAAAVMVPEECVVLRPAGEVIYQIDQGVAHAVLVQTGVRQGGMIELTAGISAGVLVAANGAGYLSDGAAVTVQGDEADK
ncbi:efflux RND transporter periplasmic adaptor subunit [Mariprofundus erugo]|uniref:Efflux RND transporter periplasmic adaptor subunit n=1 Tax=Mariprofundus erugo TaxID=2528639 RepID=A0A5R9GXZ8_9PROT|nr:efflux RND transporter periplasmic adaptor subunit [Mariprofundus erugo]TLS67884.1 efflux RND transporter periplasmic adaptor subunit [Mariprofundus erugo]